MRNLFVAIGMSLVVSCSDKEKTNQEKLIGTWVGNLCDDKNSINKDTFTFTASDIFYKGVYPSYTVKNYSINKNDIIVNNLVSYNMNFTSDNNLRLTEKRATVDVSYCLNKK